jgi:hypothetical protein
VWFSTSLLARNLTNPCLGREPKARVATPIYTVTTKYVNEIHDFSCWPSLLTNPLKLIISKHAHDALSSPYFHSPLKAKVALNPFWNKLNFDVSIQEVIWYHPMLILLLFLPSIPPKKLFRNFIVLTLCQQTIHHGLVFLTFQTKEGEPILGW